MGILGTIILLFLALIILILLNHTNVVVSNTTTTTTTTETKPNLDTETPDGQPLCSITHFGCCPDGVNSKNNLFGTNCPGYADN